MRFSFRKGCWWTLVVSLLTGPAYGQSFNIDCGGNLATPPSATYGAGAGQPGYWNTTFNGNLKDLAGNSTTVHFGGAGTALHTIPGATGDDKALMETTFDMAPSDSVSLTGLLPGNYDLYAYSWGGQIFGPRTVGFTIQTGNTYTGSVSFGSTWPGGQVLGVTYTRIPIQVLPNLNFLTLSIGSGHDFDVLAGIQLVPVPVPGAPLVLLGASLFTSRRARRKEA